MALIYWPPELPQHVLQDGYSQGMRDGRMFSKMDRGPPKSRRRSSASAIKVQAKILVSVSTLARFDRFWNDETQEGSLPFVMPDQIYNGATLADGFGDDLLTDGGDSLVITRMWLVKFDEQSPQKTPWGALFYASFSLLIYP
ncbi:hypothetical+protein [Methylocapsa aurea]|uniref:hypothetical protein n=1 Tax=Methylocapsa aurea TaxID=663610 RepID=UPI003D18F9EF